MNARRKSTTWAAVCMIAGLPGIGAAQADGKPPPHQRVDITGSLLPRATTETALPVILLTADDLDRAGVRTLEDALQLVAQNQTWVVTAWSVSATGVAPVADLRGLGATLTLVLVNGQRVVKDPYREWGVNLNTMPAAAIERIEVLADGASSVYGTDAIAGVINVITRRTFEGARVGSSVRVPQAAGGGQVNLNLLGGTGSLASQGYNLYAGIDATRERRVRAIDRDFASAVYQPERGYEATRPITFPGNYSQSGTIASTNPTLPDCRPPQSIYIPAIAPNACRHSTKSDEDVTPDVDRWSLLTRGTLAVGREHTVSAEYWRGYSRVAVTGETTELSAMTMTPASPYFPGGAAGVPVTDRALDPTRAISVAWRTADAGPRMRHDESVTQRLLAEAAGQVGGWHYRVTAHTSRADVEVVFTNGYVNRQRIVDGVLGARGAPFLNPFGPQSEAGLAYIEASQVIGRVQQAKGSLRGANGVVDGELGRLPAGPLAVAFGAEMRDERLEFRNDFSLTRVAGAGLAAATDTTGRIRSRAVFAELNAPLVKDAPGVRQLEATLAVRHDDYEAIGATTNPKVAVRWQVSQPLLVRASLARGFAVPPINRLYGTSQILPLSQGRNDPLLCPGGVPVAGADPLRDCNARFNELRGANPDLKPQHSTSWLVGLVVDVTRQASVRIDWFDYDVEGYLNVVPLDAAFQDPVTFAAHFVRCSQLAPERAVQFGCAPASVDPIAYIDRRLINISRSRTRGLDLGLRARSDAMGIGRLTLTLNGTYWKQNALQLLPGGPFNEFAGRYTSGIASPRWQHVARLAWERGTWSGHLVNRFKSGYRDSNPVTLDPAFRNHRVGHWSVFDATVTCAGIDRLTLTAGLLNVLDKPPPFSNQRDTIQDGYDPRIAGALGRSLFVSASYRFR